jgi:hypothetical protein
MATFLLNAAIFYEKGALNQALYAKRTAAFLKTAVQLSIDFLNMKYQLLNDGFFIIIW